MIWKWRGGKNPSLSRRLAFSLLISLLAVLILATATAAVTSYLQSSDIQDETLLSVAHLVNTNQMGSPYDSSVFKDDDYDDGVRVWEIGGANTPRFKIDLSIKEGFHTINSKRQLWRIYITRNTTTNKRFAISQKHSVSTTQALNSAKNTAIPLLILLLLVPALVFLVVRHSFKPLVTISNRISGTDSLTLDIDSKDNIPEEILPFVSSIESLLQKNEAYNQQQQRFIADAAHELRTPITALSLEVENVQKAVDATTKETRLNSLTLGIQRLNRLVNQLLDLARAQTSQTNSIQVVCLNELVKSQVADLYVMAEDKNIDLVVGRNETVFLHDSNHQLQHLVRNALSNAIKFSPSGGQVTIEVTLQEGEGNFCVIDNGPGVPSDQLEKLHIPFYRSTDQATGFGAGLGLAICSEIATQLKGRMRLENVVPNGFKFSYSQASTSESL
ncbi:HAMP domain-containing histidine kinase [Granulosicoccus sp.]|nr:HAMP domain-containing sensor histidine kinase [Granulosicoccus sp.]MDB4224225.1 HAMP domain-containing histidine kinase [Granulosicoccus sp.]